MSSYDVNLANFQTGNQQIDAGLQQVHAAFEQLLQSLRPMDEAQWGQSLPAWSSLQEAWSASHREVQDGGQRIKLAALGANEVFDQGDIRGAGLFA